MRQLLILGFYCEVYRREPRCRVYVNDVLLDEFDIPHTPKKNIRCTKEDDISPANYQIINSELEERFLKYIEFDDLGVTTADIKIEIKNDDNNYSNSFMTKFTRIILSFMFLSSKKLLDKIDHTINNWKFSPNHYDIKNKKDIAIFYSGSRNRFFENFVTSTQTNFTNISINNVSGIKYNVSQLWIGSSGHFYIKLKKKLGSWRDVKDSRKGFSRLGYDYILEYLYDKYKQYEDQRSANT